MQAAVERGGITMEGEDFSAVLDSLIWCKFLRKAFHDLYAESAAIYEHITGWPMTAEDLRQAGERINKVFHCDLLSHEDKGMIAKILFE